MTSDIDTIQDLISFIEAANKKIEAERHEVESINDSNDFVDFCMTLMDDMMKKFKVKHIQYNGTKYVLSNVFEQTRRRIRHRDITMDDVFRTIMNLKAKHELTLESRGLKSGDVEDRLTDCIIYDLMALYLIAINKDDKHSKE